jgi:hypothetical protein
MGNVQDVESFLKMPKELCRYTVHEFYSITLWLGRAHTDVGRKLQPPKEEKQERNESFF